MEKKNGKPQVEDKRPSSPPAHKTDPYHVSDNTNRYLLILLANFAFAGASRVLSSLIANPIASLLIELATGVVLYFDALLCLSYAATERRDLDEKLKRHGSNVKISVDRNGREIVTGFLPPFQFFPNAIIVGLTRLTGLIAGVYLGCLPFIAAWLGLDGPYVQVVLRVVGFFYACKVLDLCVARAGTPPSLRSEREEEEWDLEGWMNKRKYIWLLATEMRYASFDATHAVDESKRTKTTASHPSPSTSPSTNTLLWTYTPLLFLPATYIYPIAELKILSVVTLIQTGLETVHTILHPSCPNPLFQQPFAAKDIAEFWNIRWHQAARPFIYSLGYKPLYVLVSRVAGKDVGRVAGVLGAFGLSGMWHGWCAAALVKREDAVWVGMGLWAVFVVQGVGCVVEGAWGRREGRGGSLRWIRTGVVWVVCLEALAVWMRRAEKVANIPWPGTG